MGALVGLFHLDGRPVASGLLPAMLEVLAHRGSDSSAEWGEGVVGLGARTDWITAESRGAAALATSPDGRFTAVADARLDDRDRLARALGEPSHLSDPALIVRAFARWGEETPRHLLGDFAFAVWDAHERRLFCVRDRMGVRPFYYLHEAGRRFAFASEMRALRALPGFPSRLDEAHLADYLLVTLDHTSTFFQDVRRLPAATSLWVTAEGPGEPRAYWQPDAETELLLPSDAAYAEGFFEHFQRAVQERMRSVYPVGAALSGGLDSSAISVVARDLAAAPLPVFSAQFAGLPPELQPFIDERAYVQHVVDTGGFDLHVVEGTEIGPFTDYDEMGWHLEDAFRTINLYLHWGMFKAARQVGVRVFLDGTDGDTVVSHGHERLTASALRGDWDGFVREALAFPEPSAQRWLAWTYGVGPLARKLRRGDLPGALRGAWHLRSAFGFSWRRLGRAARAALSPAREQQARTEAFEAAFIRPGFAMRTEAWPRHVAWQPALLPDERHAHAADIRSPLFPHMLEMVDRAAAAFGIEMRFPFFDSRLIEYCLSLPADQKLAGGMARRVMRNGLVGHLPEPVRLRTTKSNLKSNFDLGMAHAAPAEIEPFLFRSDLAVAPYVEVDALRAAYRQFLTDPLRYSTVGTQIYTILSLERGLRRLGLA